MTAVEHVARSWAADADVLGAMFGEGRRPGRVLHVQGGLSDPHAGGRTVAIVHPEHGRPVVYKPRALGADVAFARLLAWLGDAAPSLPPLRGVRVVDRGTHGWAELVEPAPCDTPAARRRYHERAGALLCVAHVLRGGDLHSENVVAAGEHPVPVDLELLLAPVPAVYHRAARNARADADASSVVHTGLLPLVYLAADGSGYVEGGIRVDGDGAAVHAAGRAVRRGFAAAYRALVARRADLLAPDGPLDGFARVWSRVLLRATGEYVGVLRRVEPEGGERSTAALRAALVALPAPPTLGNDAERVARVIDAEVEALARGDVPLFTVPAGGTTLHADGRPILPDYAAESGLDAVRRRARTLGSADRHRQGHLVRAAFAAEGWRRTRATRHAAALEPPANAAMDALREACALAALLDALAVRPRRGVARWHGLDARATLRPVGHGLAHGQAGIALFLAAVAAVSGAAHDAEIVAQADAHAALARAALAPVLHALHAGAPLPRRELGGVAFALAAVARLLDCDAAYDGARRAARRLGGPARQDARGDADAACAVLALLAVHEATRDPGCLDAAVAWSAALRAEPCARRAPRVEAWLAPIALLRIALRTGDGAASVAMRVAAWVATSPHLVATGLALADAVEECSPLCVDAELAAAWRARLDTIADRCAAAARGRAAPSVAVHAHVDMLHAAAAALGRPAMADAATALAGAALAHGRRRLSHVATAFHEPFLPGLASGIAGAGYALLRAHWPALVPSVHRRTLPSAERVVPNDAAIAARP